MLPRLHHAVQARSPESAEPYRSTRSTWDRVTPPNRSPASPRSPTAVTLLVEQSPTDCAEQPLECEWKRRMHACVSVGVRACVCDWHEGWYAWMPTAVSTDWIPINGGKEGGSDSDSLLEFLDDSKTPSDAVTISLPTSPTTLPSPAVLGFSHALPLLLPFLSCFHLTPPPPSLAPPPPLTTHAHTHTHTHTGGDTTVVFHRRAQVTELNPQPYTQHPTLDPKP